MNEIVRNDILATLNKVWEIINQRGDIDYSAIKNLSNTLIHDSSIYQDEDSISLAVIIYSMSKIIERTNQVDDKLKSRIEEMHRFLAVNHMQNFHKAIRNTMLNISKLDQGVGLYIQEVMQQARVKKGTKIIEHGISIAKSADLLGISQWQLLDYLGKTTIIDFTPHITDVKKRLDFTRSLFFNKVNNTKENVSLEGTK